MLRRRASLAALALLGCAPLALPACTPGPTPPPVTAPTASPPPSSTSSGASGWTPVDPRVVRCGVDDQPQNLLGLPLPPRDDRRLALGRVAIAAEAVAVPPPTLAKPSAGARPSRLDVAPEPIDPGVPPGPPVIVERQPPQSPDGGVLPAPLATALASVDPQYEICSHLLPEGTAPPPTQAFDLELASTGAPLRVLPTAPGEISPHSRCLMERLCQVRSTTPLAEITRVRMPLKLSRELPPPPPAEVRVDAASENPAADANELQLQLRTMAAESARRCGAVPGRARARLTVTLQLSGKSGQVEGRRRRVHVVLPLRNVVAQIATQPIEGTVPPDVLTCVVNSMSGAAFPATGTSPRRTERLVLTWNP